MTKIYAQTLKFAVMVLVFFGASFTLLAQEIKDVPNTYYYNNFDDGQLGTAFTQRGTTPSLAVTSSSAANNLTIASGYSLSSLGNSTSGGFNLEFIPNGTNLNTNEPYGYEWTFLYRNSGGNTDNSDVVSNGENAWKYMLYAENSDPIATRGYFITQVGSTIFLRYKYSNSSDASHYNNLVSFDLNNIGGNNTTYVFRVQRLHRAGQYVWHLFIDPYSSTMPQAVTERGGTGAYEGTVSVYNNSALYSSTTTAGRFKFDEMKMYSMRLEITGANQTSNGISNPLVAGQQNAILYGLQLKTRGFFDIYQIQFAILGDITSIIQGGSMKLMRSADNFFGSSDDYFITSVDFFNGSPGYVQRFGFTDKFYSIGNPNGSYATVGYYFLQANVRNDASTSATYTFDGAPRLYSESGQINYVDNGSVTNTAAPPVVSGNLFDWTGAVSTAWNVAGNWARNSGDPAVPGVNDLARIGVVTYGSNQPLVPAGTFNVGNVILGSAKSATLTVNGTLNVTGDISQHNLPNGDFSSTLAGTGTINATNISVGNRVEGTTASGTANNTVVYSNVNNLNISAALIFNSIRKLIGGSNYRTNNSGLQVGNGKNISVGELRSLHSDAVNISGLTLAGGNLKITGTDAFLSTSTLGKTYILTPVTGGVSSIEYASNTPQEVYTDIAYFSDNPLIGSPAEGYSTIKFSGSGIKKVKSGNLFVKGSWESTGGKIDLVTNNAIVNFNGGVQTITDAGSDGGAGVVFKDVNFSGGSTKTLSGAGKFSVAPMGLISVTGNSILAAGGKLTLKSDVTGYANVNTLSAGSITGITHVERYMTGGSGKRGSRMLSPSINDNTTTTGNKVYQQLKASMVITGPGGAANGFDPGNATQPNATTITKYNEPATMNDGAAAQFTVIPNINNNTVPVAPPGEGFILFYRGDRSNYTPATAATSQKLSADYIPESFSPVLSGTLNQGNISAAVSKAGNPGDTNDGYNLVGNPYAATLDWEKVYASNSSNFANEIRVIQPGGAVMTRKVVSGVLTVINSTDQANAQFIQPGQGFYVRKTSAGNGAISFTEQHKATSATAPRLLSAPAPQGLFSALKMGVQGAMMNSSTTGPVALHFTIKDAVNTDETAIIFQDGFTTTSNDQADVPYLGGSTVSLATLGSDNVINAINAVPGLANFQNQAIKLRVSATAAGSYTLNFPNTLALGIYNAYLKDNYLNKTINIKEQPSYSFAIDLGIPATSGVNRFSLTFEAGEPLALHLNDFSGGQGEAGIFLQWKTAKEISTVRFEVERSTDGINFSALGEVVAAGNSYTEKVYNFGDNQPLEGTNYYRLKQVYADNTFSYSQTISILYKAPKFTNYSSLTAVSVPDGVKLDWSTISETGTLRFEIERSFDEQNYTQIGILNAVGNAVVESPYQFVDGSPSIGLNSYRLKLIYTDGDFAYSEIRSLEYTRTINLASFALKKEGATIHLDFTTAKEQNTVKVEIERSADGVSFNKIGELDGAGTSTTAKAYNFIDGNPVVGLNYYRLKQIYSDAPASISEIKSITYYVPYTLHLASFSVAKDGTTVALNFATATETNTVKMEIERSSDGTTFTKIGEVAGAGTSTVVKAYSFTDNNPVVGLNYYRLKQSYTDGTSATSEVKSITYYVPYTLHLASFSVAKEGTSVALNFATATETNTVKMEVERSSDGTAFTKIGEVAGAGTSTTPKAYSFTDNHPVIGLNYYRLKQSYTDGTSAISETKTVTYYVPYSFNVASFDLKQLNSTVLVDWSTSTEVQTVKVEIERSADGLSFNTVGSANAAGNSATERTYSFADGAPIEGQSFYRLKQTYTDGTFNYSTVRSIVYKRPMTFELVSFTLSKHMRNVGRVNFVVATHSSVRSFEIERSADGINYVKLGTLASINTQSAESYTFDDAKPITGVNYYRIKQVDADGAFMYSYIKTIDFSELVTYGIKGLTVYPNPATDVIEVNMEAINTKLTIYNLAGKPVKTANFAAGEAIRQDVRELSVGMYFLEIKSALDNKLLGTAKFFKN